MLMEIQKVIDKENPSKKNKDMMRYGGLGDMRYLANQSSMTSLS